MCSHCILVNAMRSCFICQNSHCEHIHVVFFFKTQEECIAFTKMQCEHIVFCKMQSVHIAFFKIQCEHFAFFKT